MKDKKYVYIFLHLERTGGTTINGHLYRNFKVGEEYHHLGLPWGKKGPQGEKLKDFTKLSKKQREKTVIITGHNVYYGIDKLISSKKPRYFIIVREPASELVSLYNSQEGNKKKEKRISFEKWYSLRKKNELTLALDKRFRGSEKKQRLSKKILWILHSTNEKIPGADKRKNLAKNLLRKKLSSEKFSKLSDKEKFENAKNLLDSCWFVGLTETLNSDLKYLFKKLEVPQDYENFAVTGSKDSKEINPKHKKIKKKIFKLDKKTKEKIYRENPLDVKLYNYAKKLNKKTIKNLK